MTDPLELVLGTRVAALEASASEPDWADVRRKAQKLAVRRLAFRAGTGTMIALLAVLAATPAFGLRGRLVQLFGSSQPAPAHVVTDFAQLDVAAPAGMAPGVIASETREVMEVPLSTGKNAILWVAPTRSGGFCSGLSTRAGDGGGGCDRDRSLSFSPGVLIPGPVSPDGTILEPPVVIDGDTLLPKAAKVLIHYQDGAIAETPIVWVSAPIDAGFFVYEVPKPHWQAGHHPTSLVLEDGEGHELARAKSYFEEGLQGMQSVDPETGAPAPAIQTKRRELISITSEQGTEESLWVAPRRDGGQCYWLTSDGRAGRASGCPAPSTRSRREITGGLLSGSAPILFEGEVGADVASLELYYQDGDVQRLQPAEGFVLGEVPSRHWPRGHRLDKLIALDSRGRTIAERRFDSDTPGTYPCARPAEVGGGQQACT